MPNDAISLAAPREFLHELESRGEIRRRDRDDIPQTVFIPAGRSAIGLLSFELGESVQHVSIAGGVAAELLECRACLRRTSRKRVYLRQRETHLGASRIKLTSPPQFLFCLGVATCLQVGEPKIRVAEWIVRREPGELLELGLSLR